MKVYRTKEVKNLALVGHSGVGKTNLIEALLFQSGATKKRGLTMNKDTVSDFTIEEKERGSSIGTSVIPVEWRNMKVNFIDTPGDLDFIGDAIGALRAAEAALIVVDATSGVQVGTERMWKYAEEVGLPRIFFINKIDGENVNFRKLMDEIESYFGKKVIPFSVPIGEGEDFVGVTDVIFQKGYKYGNSTPVEVELNHDQFKATERVYEEIAEVVATSDETLMDKYFAGESFTRDELLRGVTSALLSGDAVPLLVGSAEKGIGIDILLNTIINYMPSPDDERAHTGFRYESGEERKGTANEPFSAYVFKTITDPYVGKISLFKVMSGKLTKDTTIVNTTKNEPESFNGPFIMRGKEQIPVDEIQAGDIGAVTKLEYTQTRDTLADKAHPVLYKRVRLPKPIYFRAIDPATRGDEEKLLSSLRKLQEEDPSFSFDRSSDTGQLIIRGQGVSQLRIIKSKLETVFDVKIVDVPFIIPYKETITSTVKAQGRHKKQSGGAGQFGDVWIRFEPIESGFEFDEEIHGGSVPRNYFPAVEKGLRESMQKGTLAGYPVDGVRAVLYDGSYHDVDSNEVSFVSAASIAFREGIAKANPILLEPIMSVEVNVPDNFMGDVMGDITRRKGRILGMDQEPGGYQLIIAEVPLAELFEYATDLRAMTQGRAKFSMEQVRYEQVPHDQAEKIVQEANQ